MKLTVIIRDESPLIHLNEPVSHRRVTIDLTADQAAALALNHGDEGYSLVFIEQPTRPTAK